MLQVIVAICGLDLSSPLLLKRPEKRALDKGERVGVIVQLYSDFSNSATCLFTLRVGREFIFLLIWTGHLKSMQFPYVCVAT